MDVLLQIGFVLLLRNLEIPKLSQKSSYIWKIFLCVKTTFFFYIKNADISRWKFSVPHEFWWVNWEIQLIANQLGCLQRDTLIGVSISLLPFDLLFFKFISKSLCNFRILKELFFCKSSIIKIDPSSVWFCEISV